ESGGRDAELGGVRHASGRDQDRIGGDRLRQLHLGEASAGFERERDLVVGELEPVGDRPAEHGVGRFEDAGEFVRGLFVDVSQQAGPTGEDGHLGAEGGEDVGELHGDDAGADDDQPFRLCGTAHDGVRGEDGIALGVDASRVEAGNRGDEGMGAGGNDDAVGGDVLPGGGAHTLLAGEVNVFGHDGDVRLPVAAAILASAGLDGVDAGEDAVLEG